MSLSRTRNLAHDLVLPTLLFSALGAMAWAVRGCAGAGGMNAHVAPGFVWGTAWWFLSRDGDGEYVRRYSSGWIILAVTAGFAIAGERGWMQWHHFYDGHLSLNYAKQDYTPIARWYGSLWYFIAGSAWAGLPACFLAWCATQRPLRAWEWTLRIACGLAGGYLAWRLFARFPQYVLPLYDQLEPKYHDFHANPSLIKLYRDCASSARHVGFCLGFLLFELARKDWKNIILVLTVGIINGAGWGALQNWKWFPSVWPGAAFNNGRCWEACGGVSIGIGLGAAYFLVNQRATVTRLAGDDERTAGASPARLWALTGALLAVIGWTQFWPPAIDLRRPAPEHLAEWSIMVCGAICIAFGALFLVAAIACARSRQQETARRRIVWWGDWCALLLLGWFVRTQLVNTYSDEPADGAMGGWFGPANIYFAILLSYACMQLARGWRSPGAKPERKTSWSLDGLAAYGSLGVVLLWCIGVGMGTSWHAVVYLGLVGLAFGAAYRMLSARNPDTPIVQAASTAPLAEDPNLERWGAFLGFLYGLGLTARKGLKGWFSIYRGHEEYWDGLFWNWIAAAMLLCMVIAAIWILIRRLPRGSTGDALPHAYGMVWLMLITQNVLAQAVTGPLTGSSTAWIEFVFSVLYLILFPLTAVIVYHVQYARAHRLRDN